VWRGGGGYVFNEKALPLIGSPSRVCVVEMQACCLAVWWSPSLEMCQMHSCVSCFYATAGMYM
jgi:hypothetical protein